MGARKLDFIVAKYNLTPCLCVESLLLGNGDPRRTDGDPFRLGTLHEARPHVTEPHTRTRNTVTENTETKNIRYLRDYITLKYISGYLSVVTFSPR